MKPKKARRMPCWPLSLSLSLTHCSRQLAGGRHRWSKLTLSKVEITASCRIVKGREIAPRRRRAGKKRREEEDEMDDLWDLLEGRRRR
jgi:hypothetical protein